MTGLAKQDVILRMNNLIETKYKNNTWYVYVYIDPFRFAYLYK